MTMMEQGCSTFSTDESNRILDRLAGLEILVGLHGFGGIHVDGFHEPSRLVGSDGQEGEVRHPKAGSNFLVVR